MGTPPEMTGVEARRTLTGALAGGKVRLDPAEVGEGEAKPEEILLGRGYGEKGRDGLELHPWEALYLVSDGWLEVYGGRPRRRLGFQELLNAFRRRDKSVWSRYLVYRDLRARGYVVKKGFGPGADFRVYDRGDYGEKSARVVVCTVFEGEPIPLRSLLSSLASARSMKKEVILGVIERRGEVVYYSLSDFNL